MIWLLGVMVLLTLLIAPWWALIEARAARREVARLRGLIDVLERRVRGGPKLEHVPDPWSEPSPPPPPPIAITTAPMGTPPVESGRVEIGVPLTAATGVVPMGATRFD